MVHSTGARELKLEVTLAPALFAEHLPLAVTVSAMVLLVVPSMWRLASERKGPSIHTLPVALLAFVFLPMSVLVSPQWLAVSWPRAVCLSWCLAAFTWIVNDTGAHRLRIHAHVGIFVGAGTGFALLSMTLLRLPENEVGSVLSLFLAMALAMVAAPRALLAFPRALWIASALVLLAAAVQTGSRGALTGTGVAVVLLVVLLGKRKGVVALALTLVIAACAAPLLWHDVRARTFLIGGTVQGASFSNITTGRLPIWESSLHAVLDVPFTGTGLGVLGDSLFETYSTGYTERKLEDAHNQFIQAAADFGIPGGIAWLGVWGVAAGLCLKLLRRLPAGHLPFVTAAGATAALGGHFVHSLVDSVSPGWPGGIPFWYLVGLVVRMERQRILGGGSEDGKSRILRRRFLGVPTTLAILGAAAALTLVPAIAATGNRDALSYLRVLFNGSAEDRLRAVAEMKSATAPSCRSRWLRGLVADAADNPSQRFEEWRELIRCSPSYIRLVFNRAPDDRGLAEVTRDAWPRNPAGYFWLASLEEKAAPDEAIRLLRQGLERSPTSGREWRKLGDLLAAGDKDLSGALDAFSHACDNGDPGAGGCSMGGLIAEKLGRPEEALALYRKSNWPTALERARELEKEMAGRK